LFFIALFGIGIYLKYREYKSTSNSQQGQTQTAKSSFEDILTNHFEQGREKADKGGYVNAIKDYDTAIRLNPRFTEAYLNRADAKTTLGLYAAAITDYDAVIHLKPDSVEAYVMPGFVKTDLGQYTEAIADYDAAIRLKPDYAFVYVYRGAAKHKLDQHFPALADYDKAIELAKDDPSTLKQIDRVHSRW
jgi:tetratricopeptide (TPR) repeat protein